MKSLISYQLSKKYGFKEKDYLNPKNFSKDPIKIRQVHDVLNKVKRQMVMVRQYRHGFDEVLVELCAGVVEDGEAPVDAAKRELLEETGYAGGEWREVMTIGQNPSICDNLTHCFVAEGVEKVSGQHLDASEDIEVLLMSKAEVLDMLINDQQKQALMAAPLWRYFYTQK